MFYYLHGQQRTGLTGHTAMTRTDPYAMHRAPQVDAQLAYCNRARATLDRIQTARKPSFLRRLINLFR